MERRLNERSKLVKAANDTQDPLEQLPSFKKYDKKGINVEFSTEKATNLDQVLTIKGTTVGLGGVTIPLRKVLKDN